MAITTGAFGPRKGEGSTQENLLCISPHIQWHYTANIFQSIQLMEKRSWKLFKTKMAWFFELF